MSVAAIHSDHPGFLTVYPCGGVTPLVATVNHGPREVVAGTAYVPVGDDGTICVYSLNPVDVIVDLTGTFSSTGELVFQPVEPTRMLDTRVGIGGWSPIHGPDQTLDVRVAPSDARAVSGTLTLVTPTRPGFLTAWGCGTRPPTSNLNAETGQILANSVTTGVSDSGRLCIRSHSPTSTLFDANGWWVPAG